jgi:RNA polymerase sigma-70 factor (ECF subfamily)
MAAPPSRAEFALIVREHTPGVARALRRLGVGEREVAQAAQEAFVALHRALAAGEPRANLRALAYRVAVQVASDHRTRAYRRPRAEGRAPDPPGPAPAQVGRSERLARLDRALERLSPVHREVLVLVELEGLPWDEAAAALGVSETTATSRLHAARAALREAWGALSREAPRGG